MKPIMALIILFSIFAGSIAQAVDAVSLPPQPPHLCNILTQTPSDYSACEAQYTADKNAWDKNSEVVSYFSNQNTRPKLDKDGNLTPTAPTNNCVIGTPDYATCFAKYNADQAAYLSTAQAAVNGVRTQLDNDPALAAQHASMQAQAGQQDAESARIQVLTDTSATGSLQEVQAKNQDAYMYYNNSSFLLSKFADSIKNSSDNNNDLCVNNIDYNACAKTAAGIATAVAYEEMSTKAGVTAAELVNIKSQSCEAQKAISMTRTSCDPTDPSSPVYTPGFQTPPNISWFDPFTGLCAINAPPQCKEMFNVVNTSGALTQTQLNSGIRKCPSGGTDCISTVEKTTTPLGVKYTFKSKIGKGYSFYANDVKDEKSLIKAGLTAAQAKSVLSEINGTKSIAENAAMKIAGGFSKIAQAAKSALGISTDADSQKKVPPKTKPTATIGVQPNVVPVIVNRRPSMEGMSRDLNGDLIGVRGDNIFKMINRRYQDKDQQVWFFGQYQ